MAPMMMTKVMLKDRFKLGDGLGKYRQDTQKLHKVPKNKEKVRLRYKPTITNKIKVANKKREKEDSAFRKPRTER